MSWAALAHLLRAHTYCNGSAKFIPATLLKAVPPLNTSKEGGTGACISSSPSSSAGSGSDCKVYF